VQTAQVVTDGVSVPVQHVEEIVTCGFDQWLVPQRIIRPATKSSCTSVLRAGNSMRRHFIHHALPGPQHHLRIVCSEMHATYRKIQIGLAMRFILGVKKSLGFKTDFGAKAAAAGGSNFLPVKNALGASKEPVFELHILRGRVK